MKIQGNPVAAYFDMPVEIVITDVPAGKEVEVKAEMSYPWAPGVRFASRAFFMADNQGQVDLSVQKPLHGDYDFADSMGLIDALAPVSGKLTDIAEKIDVSESMYITLTAHCQGNSTSLQLERYFMAADVERLILNEEIVGQLFSPAGGSDKTIILLGGSDGNLNSLLPMAALYASWGMNALALAYFNQPGLPAALSAIPLEYFEKAFHWLAENPLTANNDIYLQGTSKGGEAVLLLAAHYPIVKKAAAFAPHGYCFQGLDYKNHSSWTYKGQELPYIRIKNSSVFSYMANCFIKNKPFGYAKIYRDAINQADNHEAARIKIENAHADILLFAGTEDNIWTADDGCQLMIEKLKQHNYPCSYEYIAYKGAGHSFYAPYFIPASQASIKIAPRMTWHNGGSLRLNAFSQKDSWERCKKFFASQEIGK